MEYPEEYDDEAPGAGQGESGGGETFPFGKQKGKTFAEVFEADKGYVSWVFGQTNPSGPLAAFKSYCESRGFEEQPQQQQQSQQRKRDAPSSQGASVGEGVMAVGKHKGKSFAEVAESDSGYCDWVRNSQGLTGNLLEFQTFLSGGQGAVASIPSPAKRFNNNNNSNNNNNNYGNNNKNNSGGGGGSDVVPSGKHQGKSFDELLKTERSYLEWVVGLDDLKANWMKDLKAFAVSNGVTARAPRSY